MNERALGKDLNFISKINRDGSGTKAVEKDHIKTIQEESFEMNCLSITEQTYIASGFNSFVVTLKPQ